MARLDSIKGAHIKRAVRNLTVESKGDWYRDPWGWPEYDFLLRDKGRLVRQRLEDLSMVREVAPVDVPKENFGLRPAIVLELVDRVAYQLLVDTVSVETIADLREQAFGWRLPLKEPKAGKYARQDYQWRSYRGHLSLLSGVYGAGLKTDIAACFSSIPVTKVVEALIRKSSQDAVVDKLARMLHGWESQRGTSGLPQRSTASAVLANMYLSSLDEVMASHSTSIGVRWPSMGPILSFARWMDDMWIFGNDLGDIRRAQVDLEAHARTLHLVLNSGKTKLLEGAQLVSEARKIQNSAVDDALIEGDSGPLEELIDLILDEVETADRTTIKFATTRMRRTNVRYRLDELVEFAPRMPHAADSLSRLFRKMLPSAEIQDWLTDYVGGGWNTFEWSLAQFGTAVPSRRKPRASVRSIYEDALANEAASLPLVALAAQRLSSWEPLVARELISDRIAGEPSPHVRRVLSLAGLRAGEPPKSVKRWLRVHEDNEVTLRMLKRIDFASPRLSSDYN